LVGCATISFLLFDAWLASEEAFFERFARTFLAKRSCKVGFGEKLGAPFSSWVQKSRRSDLAEYTFEYLVDVLRYLKFEWTLFSTSKKGLPIPFFENDIYASVAQWKYKQRKWTNEKGKEKPNKRHCFQENSSIKAIALKLT
jgi:hypothetical protein